MKTNKIIELNQVQESNCPFFEEVRMVYCRAYPVKKLIPATAITLETPCQCERHQSCPVFQDATRAPGEKPKRVEPVVPKKPADSGEYCVWFRNQTVSYRLCTRNYECPSCEFAQMLYEKNGKYVESSEVKEAIERMREGPASQRICKYAIISQANPEPCSYQYGCWRCPVYQVIRETLTREERMVENE